MPEQTANGHDNVLVSVDGNKNTLTITLGRASLILDQAHKRRPAVSSELGLLRTEARATTLVGRDADLERFRRWLASPAPIAVQCVIGRGGAGKTRFGIELCERAEADGWTAGFVTADRLTSFHGAGSLSDWLWKGPTLLVIDYAAAKTAILREWLDELARRPVPDTKQHPLRILLLERHADREIGWWADLGRQGGLSGPRGDSFLEGVEPYILPTLTDLEDRRRLMAQVMKQVAIVKAIFPAPRPPEPGADQEFDRALSTDGLDNEPLYLMMAAIVALDVGASSALSQSRIELAHAIACHQNERLEKIAKGHGVDPQLFSHLAACVTLQGGCDRDEAERLVDQERTTNPSWTNVSPEKIAEWLADGSPGLNGGVDAVRPDLIGGAFLLLVLRWKKRSLAKQIVIVDRAWERAGVAVAQTIIRTAVDHAGHDPKHDSLQWLHHLIERTKSDYMLASIVSVIPERTVALRECACAAQERMVDISRQTISHEPRKIANLAVRLNNLANRLSDLGRRDDALAAASEAVGHYRLLVRQYPDTFRSHLAMSLITLTVRLHEQGRREEALAAASEAVEQYSQLSQQYLDAFTPSFAGSLNNLANCLSDLDRHEDALAAVSASSDIYRQLARQHPDAYLPHLAMSLHTLANRLSDLDRREEALTVAGEAVRHYSFLARRYPDAFSHILAGSLNNMANRLIDLGRYNEALAAANEAVDHYRELAQQRANAFSPDLAVALVVLASCHDALEQSVQAIEVNREAIIVLSKPFFENPRAFYDRMTAMGQKYIARRKQFGLEFDRELLLPIAIVLGELEKNSERTGE